MKTEKRKCEKHGEYIAECVEYAHFSRWSWCPECQKEHDAAAKLEREENEKMQKKFMIAENMNRSGIPKKYSSAQLSCLESVSGNKNEKAIQYASRYIAAFENIRDEGVSMIFFGSPGTGKTHIACAVAIEIIKQGFSAKYITAFDLLNEISDCFRTKEPVNDVVKDYLHSDLLVIDEIGIQYGKDHDSIWLYKIINSRYVNNRPTIIISNLSQEDLEAFLGTPTYDRLQEGKGTAIPFYWESHRKKQALKLVG